MDTQQVITLLKSYPCGDNIEIEGWRNELIANLKFNECKEDYQKFTDLVNEKCNGDSRHKHDNMYKVISAII